MITEFKKGDLVVHLLWKNEVGIVISACDEPWRDEYDTLLTVKWITGEQSSTYIPPQSIAKADHRSLRKVKDES